MILAIVRAPQRRLPKATCFDSSVAAPSRRRQHRRLYAAQSWIDPVRRRFGIKRGERDDTTAGLEAGHLDQEADRKRGARSYGSKVFKNTANRADMDERRNDMAGVKMQSDQIDKLMLLDQQRRMEPLKAAVNELTDLGSKVKGRYR